MWRGRGSIFSIFGIGRFRRIFVKIMVTIMIIKEMVIVVMVMGRKDRVIKGVVVWRRLYFRGWGKGLGMCIRI